MYLLLLVVSGLLDIFKQISTLFGRFWSKFLFSFLLLSVRVKVTTPSQLVCSSFHLTLPFFHPRKKCTVKSSLSVPRGLPFQMMGVLIPIPPSFLTTGPKLKPQPDPRTPPPPNTPLSLPLLHPSCLGFWQLLVGKPLTVSPLVSG